MASAAEIRSNRLAELSRLVEKLHGEGKDPNEIHQALMTRANQMASKHTAREYVDEVIRRFSK